MQKGEPGQRRHRSGRQSEPEQGRAGPMRIAKALARAGLCSRREAERWIEDGRVAVNGELLKSPARDVQPSDRILVDGKELPAASPRACGAITSPAASSPPTVIRRAVRRCSTRFPSTCRA